MYEYMPHPLIRNGGCSWPREKTGFGEIPVVIIPKNTGNTKKAIPVNQYPITIK